MAAVFNAVVSTFFFVFSNLPEIEVDLPAGNEIVSEYESRFPAGRKMIIVALSAALKQTAARGPILERKIQSGQTL